MVQQTKIKLKAFHLGFYQNKIVKLVFFSIFLTFTTLSTSHSADLPTIEEVVADIAAEVVAEAGGPIIKDEIDKHDWGGFYVGVLVGGHISEENSLEGFDTRSEEYLFFEQGRFEEASIGGFAGYSFEHGNYIFGVEAHLSGSLGSEQSFEGVENDFFDEELSSELTTKGSIRARFGYAFDRFLPYVTGGFAFGRNELGISSIDPGSDFEPVSESDTRTLTGFVVGGGFEYAFNEYFLGRLEYTYTQFGEETYFKGSEFGSRTVDVGGIHTIAVGVSISTNKFAEAFNPR